MTNGDDDDDDDDDDDEVEVEVFDDNDDQHCSECHCYQLLLPQRGSE